MKTMKKGIAVLLAALLCVSLLSIGVWAEEAPTYDWYTNGGDGTADDPYVIGSDTDLMGLGKLSQGPVDGVTDEAQTFESHYIRLDADLDLDGIDWTGYVIDHFAGTFDGNGKTIRGLTIGASDKNGQGLIRTADAGSLIKDLTVDGITANMGHTSFGTFASSLYGSMENCHAKNVNVTVTFSGTSGLYAGLVGYARSGSVIDSCSAENVCIVDALDRVQQSGGLVGTMIGAEITDSSVTNVTISAQSILYQNGGLVGIANAGSEISGCTVGGNVTLTAVTKQNSRNGGLAGKMEGCTVTDCTVSADVEITASAEDLSAAYDNGGFAGYLVAGNAFTRCTVSGNTLFHATGSQNNLWGAGGFFGTAAPTAADGTNMFQNCTVSGNVTVTGNGYIQMSGGFAGNIISNPCTVFSVAEFHNCSVSGNVNISCTSSGEANSNGAVPEVNYCGGFTGSTKDGGRSTYENCSVSGDVSITSTTKANNLGGFVGIVLTGPSAFDHCDMTGDVLCTAGTELNNAGGFCGWFAENGTSDDYSVASFTAHGATVHTVGGFIGDVGRQSGSTQSITNCTVDHVNITSDGYLMYVGGFAGISNRSTAFENCEVATFVLSNEGSDGNVGNIGGFLGETQNGTWTPVTLTNCHVRDLTMTLSGVGDPSGDSNSAAGFLGATAEKTVVENCSVTGTITSTAEDVPIGGFLGDLGWNNVKAVLTGCTANVDIETVGVAGGFVASSGVVKLYRSSRDTGIEATDCIATGNVTSTGGAAGGFVGEGYRGTYVNCEASGSVSGVTAGGFWGEVIPNPKTSVADDLTITDCTASPIVLGSEYAAGFIGYAKLVDDEDSAKETTLSVDGNTVAEYVAGTTNTGVALDDFANPGDLTLADAADGVSLVTPNGDGVITMTSDGTLQVPTTGATLADEGGEQEIAPGAFITTDIAVLDLEDGIRAAVRVPYTVIYTGTGVQTQTRTVLSGDPTPTYSGTLSYAGYIFAGWSPAVADTVTADATYTAQWIYYNPAPVNTEADTEEEDDVNIEDEEVPLADLPFIDVLPTDWFYEAVIYVYERELMQGMSENLFDPDGSVTRGMVATVLYRLEEEPDVANAIRFTDVADTDYFAAAAAWSEGNGVFVGFPDGTFGGELDITREQLAAVLYRYATLKGYEVEGEADLSAYEDAAEVSAYAFDAMAWAVGTELIKGRTETALAANGTAFRAELATILMRFVEAYAE